MSPLDAAFPDRPLTLSAPIARWRNWLLGAICLAVPIGLGWWGWASLGPAILDDLSLRGVAEPVNGNIRGRCQTRYGIFQSCDVTITAGVVKGSGPATREVTYIFLDPHLGAYTVQAMGARDRPGLLTTDLGQDKLTNRALTLAGMMAIAVGVGIAGVALILRGGRQRKAMRGMSGQRLRPVPISLQRGREGWFVTPLDGTARSQWQLPAKAEPFWLYPAQGVALGVTAPGAPVFPLDRELAWVDLTEEEKRCVAPFGR